MNEKQDPELMVMLKYIGAMKDAFPESQQYLPVLGGERVVAVYDTKQKLCYLYKGREIVSQKAVYDKQLNAYRLAGEYR